MKKFLAILAFLGGLASSFAYDEWRGFSEPFPIRDAIRMGDSIMLATDGGMRLKGHTTDVLYTPDKGLEASVFYGVAKVEDSLYAVSEYGLIACYEGEKWRVVNRSFLSRKSRVVPGKVIAANKYLAILFEDGLAFFDTKIGSSVLQIDRVGDVSLSVYPPQDIASRNDTLFISTIHGSYARKMDWNDLSRDFRLVDPATWVHVDTDIFKKDTKHVFVKGKSLTDEALFKDGESRIQWVLEGKDEDGNDDAFLVGHDAIFWYGRGKAFDYTDYLIYKLGAVYEIQAIPGGGIIAVSPDGRASISRGTFWEEPTDLFFGLGNSAESYANRMKALAIMDDDATMYHVWGQGFMIWRGLVMLPRYISPGDGTCLDLYAENYMVAVGTTAAPDKSGFLTATGNRDGSYSLAYITVDGEVSCIKGVGSSRRVGPLVAKMDGSDWVVYVSARDNFSAFSAGALDIIRFPSPSKNGGRIIDAELKTLPNIEKRTPIDFALDEKNGVLWMVSTSDISYLELDQDTIRKPVSTNGLSGAEYSSIDVDPHGNVWVGSTNQGAYRLQRKGESFDTLLVSHYTTKNGLLSNGVHDVAVDKGPGMVWFAHDEGVTRYARNDLREATTFMTDSAEVGVKAYPIPFRPALHSYFCIDNIAENAHVDIYNRGGALIRSFVGDEIAGGKVEWDGIGKNGKHVAPGVYYYVVRTSSKKERGKFLVVR